MSDEPKKDKNNKVFRKAALERLSSPDQLDTLMQITTPRAWLALAVIGALVLALIAWSILGELTDTVDGVGFLTSTTGDAPQAIIFAPTAGQLTSITVSVGDRVQAGDVVAQMTPQEADGDVQTIEVTAPGAGEITAQFVATSDAVEANQPLLSLAPDADTSGSPLQALIYVPFIDAQDIQAGMDVRISPLPFPSQEYGFLLGEIQFVGQTIATNEAARAAFPDESVLQVIVQLETDDTPSGYAWTLADGPEGEIRPETPVQATIIIAETRPIARVFPVLGE